MEVKKSVHHDSKLRNVSLPGFLEKVWTCWQISVMCWKCNEANGRSTRKTQYDWCRGVCFLCVHVVHIDIGSEQSCSGGGDDQRSSEGAGFVGSCSYLHPHWVHRQQWAHSHPHQGLEGYCQPGRYMEHTLKKKTSTQLLCTKIKCRFGWTSEVWLGK